MRQVRGGAENQRDYGQDMSVFVLLVCVLDGHCDELRVCHCGCLQSIEKQIVGVSMQNVLPWKAAGRGVLRQHRETELVFRCTCSVPGGPLHPGHWVFGG